MKKTKMSILAACTIVAALLSVENKAVAQSPSVVAVNPITINVIPALAPNVYGSPNYSQWDANAIYALENGVTSYGDPSSPSYYYQAPSSISMSQNVVSGFNSWMGQANPGITYGAAFANELGNRLQFGLVVNGNGSLFSISQLSFTASSSDPNNTLGFSYGAGSYNYSSDYVGVIYGAGGQSDVAEYTYVNSGLSTQPVNELFGRGSGNAVAAYETDPGANDQERLDNAANLGSAPVSFMATYAIGAVQGSATEILDPLVPVPEPSTYALVIAGGLGVLTVAQGKKRAFKQKGAAAPAPAA